MAYISQRTRADLDTPHEIFRSPIKLAILSVLILGAAGGCLFGAWMVAQATPVTAAKGAIPAAVWVLLGIGAIFVLLFLLRMLPKWRAIGQPALTISTRGIAIRGKDLVPWAEILGNTWRSQSYNGIPIGAAIEVQAGWGQVTCDAYTLKCSSAEYLRLCELYRQVAAPVPDAAPRDRAAVVETGAEPVADPARAAEPDDVGEWDVRRRVPALALLGLLGGLAIAAILAVVIAQAFLGSSGKPVYSGFVNTGRGAGDLTYAYVFGAIALVVAGLSAPVVWAWCVEPKSLVIGMSALRYGQRSIPYTTIASLAQRTGRATLVTAQDGTRLRLRWAIWADGPLWTELLTRRSYRPLYAAAWQAIGAGAQVGFGGNLSLDRQALHLKGRTIPLETITDLYVQTGAENGVAYRTIRIRTQAREHSIDEAKMQNPHLFHGLIQALLEPQARAGSPLKAAF
ncbi:MAG TPA: hypothetical protein VGM87_01760 [Roseomonas sp.]